MVGYPSLTSYNRTDGLNTLKFDTEIDSIWTYSVGTQKMVQMGESDNFRCGCGDPGVGAVVKFDVEPIEAAFEKVELSAAVERFGETGLVVLAVALAGDNL